MKITTAVLLLLFTTAAAHAATDKEAIQAERLRQNAVIAKVRDLQNSAAVDSAEAKKKIAAAIDDVASFWTDDVTICRGLGIQLAGKAAYRTLYEGDASSATPLVYERLPVTIEVSPHWPLAFESGTWSGHLGSVSGPVVISGRYSAQWVKRDGLWLIRSEVFVALDGAGVGLEYKAAP
jgi:ketosteroid isomerase-like protein